MMAERLRIVVTAGGTGGHLFPALVVGEELKRMGHTVLFVGSAAGLEGAKATAAGFEFKGLDVKGFDRGNPLNMLKALVMLPAAVWEAVKTLGVFRPHAVIGCAGYASGPSCLAAALKGTPLFLLEQNVYPGLVTRRLAKRARRVYAAFPETAAWLKGATVVAAGNPTRGDFMREPTRDFGAKEKTVLVMGGSQGARSVNRAVVDALPLLKRMPLKIYHQTGARDAAEVKAAYAKEIPGATVEPFFENVAEIMLRAHLAVARAGASTCAELSLAALPAVLVPFPGAGGHQKLNAKALESGGGAVVMDDADLTPGLLVATLKGLAEDPEKLARMSAGMKKSARPDAAHVISRDIVRILEG